MSDWAPIKLNSKVLGHISQGMYRTPAGAIKELVSNAYDAGAENVTVHTDFPRFLNFSCKDNGCGILRAEFERLMTGGIGDSSKPIDGSPGQTTYGRPVVGRLGVGLLSLAQICTQFEIVSHHPETETAFSGSIRFAPYIRRNVEKIKTKESSQSITAKASNTKVDDVATDLTELIAGGEFKITHEEYDPKKKGVLVTTKCVRDSFIKTMSNLKQYARKSIVKKSGPYASFTEYLNCVYSRKVSTLFFSSPYDQLILGLAMASPLPYPEDDSKLINKGTVLLRVPEMSDYQKRLKKHTFKVFLDNMDLRRPVLLPSDREGHKLSELTVLPPSEDKFEMEDGATKENVVTKRYNVTIEGHPERFQFFIFEYKRKVNGTMLDFWGYMFLQTGRLYPKEIQGILVRLRDVAISTYDVNMMTYPTAEGPRFSMVSSEIMVREGLDDALKVDRDGFNTLDPHYIRLQSFIHCLLHNLIFPGSWKEEKERNKAIRVKKAEVKQKRFIKQASESSKYNIKSIQIISKSKDAKPFSFNPNDRQIVVNRSHPDVKDIFAKKRDFEMISQIVTAFELANVEKTEELRRKKFLLLLSNVFRD